MSTYGIRGNTNWRDVARRLCGMPAFQERMKTTYEERRGYISSHPDLGIFVTKIWTPAGELLAWDLKELYPELSSEKDPRVYALIQNGGTRHQIAELTRAYFKNLSTRKNAIRMSEEERLFAFGSEEAEGILDVFSRKLEIPESGNYLELIGPQIEELILSEFF